MAERRPAARPSMHELIQRRRREGFVGRLREQAAYRENFTLPPEHEAHRFVFHVRGDAGVGKTTLVRRLEQTAGEHRALTACVDEAVGSVPGAMEAISAQLARQGHPLKSFDKLLATYRQRRHEAESVSSLAPGPGEGAAAGPQGPSPSAAGTAAARAGLAGLTLVPGLGVLAGAADPVQVAAAADRIAAALSARFRDHDDVRLVMSPLDVLTPVFLEDLAAAAATAPWVALFFDTYERTGPLLDAWLRDLVVDGRRGSLPANAVVTLAGQGTLDPRHWADYSDLVADIPLVPFTDAEARQLLAAKGVTDEPVVEDVLRLTGGLPVLVSMLAETRPTGPDALGDPSGTAVERFLKWETDEVRRAAALAAALPRQLDEDVYRAAVDEPAAGLFGWLRSLPFVTDRAGRCQYHGVVRTAMLRMQRNQSPQRWRARHLRLAGVFADWRRQREEALRGDERWEDEAWLGHRLQESYHLLCADPRDALRRELRAFLHEYIEGASDSWLRHWVRTLAEAGEDTGSDVVRDWGTRLGEMTDEEQPGPAVVRHTTTLLAEADQDAPTQALCHTLRGGVHRERGAAREALADYGHALRLDPLCARAYAGRGATYVATERYEEALPDLDEALRLRPDSAWILDQRGLARRRLERYEEALADFDRSLELYPDDGWTLTNRAMTHFALKNYESGLADFTRVLEEHPPSAWALAERGRAYWHLDRNEEALADFDQAVALDPDYGWAQAIRGAVLQALERYEDALAGYARAIALDPDDAFSYTSRGETLHALGRHEEALADLDRGVALYGGDNRWPLAERAACLASLDRLDEARSDFDRAIALGADYALSGRLPLLRRLGRYEEALADADRLLAADPEYAWAYAERGELCRFMDRFDDAVADFTRALAIQPDDVWALSSRGQTYGHLGLLTEALADLDASFAINPDQIWARRLRSMVHLALGDAGAALADADHAVRLDPDAARSFETRAVCHRRAGRFDEAAADLDRALALDPESDDALVERALLDSRTQGPAAVAGRWAGIEARLDEDDGEWTEEGRICIRLLVRVALGDFDRADRLLTELIALPPAWDSVEEAIWGMEDLAAAPGADTVRLGAFRDRLVAFQTALTASRRP